MPDPLLEFDPTSEDAANSPLSVWNTSDYIVTAFNPDAANQAVQWASSVDTEGSLPASVKDENRTISMTIECLSAAALRSLQAKVAKVSRERGTLKWTLPNSEVIIFDLLARETFKPEFDFKYFVHAGAYCTVEIALTAAPYGRGAEVDLGDNVETTLPFLIFTDTGVKGDMPGVGRLLVDNDQATAQVFMMWGVQSRNYSSASTAALYYEAESCALINGTLTAQAGASGGGNNVITNSNPGAPDLSEICYIGASSTAQTHIGKFRIFARVYAPNTNTGEITVYAKWQPTVGAPEVTNPSVTLNDAGTPQENKFLIVDLGEVSIPKAVRGSQGWLGKICNTQTVAADDILIDWIALMPLDEGYGEASAIAGRSLAIATNGKVEISSTGALATSDGTRYRGVDIYEGDYLRVPPAGAEARTLRTIVKFSRMVPARSGDFTTTSTGDAGIDDISARLFYSPRYLVVPEP